MPRIPTYEQQSTPGATLNVRTLDTGADAIVRGGAAIAAGADRMSRSMRYAEEVAARKAIADDMTAAHLAMTKASAHWTQYTTDTQVNAEGDPTGTWDRMGGEFDKYGSELVGTAKTPEGKAYLTAEVAQLRSQLGARMVPWEAERGIEHRGTLYAQSIDQQRIAVRADPRLYDQVLEQQSVALTAAALPGPVRDKLWFQTRESIAASAVETLVQRDPAGTLKALRSAPGKSGSSVIEGLSADDRDRAMSAAEAELRRREAEARARAAEARQSLAEAEADAFAFKASGMPAQLPSRSAYVAAYGAAEGNKRYSQKTQLFGVYDVVNAAVMAPRAEGKAMIESYRPTQQQGAADQAQTMQAAAGLYEQQRKAFEADPAGVLVQRDPQLRTLYEAALAPGAAPADVQAYVTKVRAAQEAAGIAVTTILPAGQADAIAAQLAFDPKQPEKRAQQLQALSAQWGRAYPALLREVAPKMDGTARVMVGMAPEKAARLDAALAAGGKEQLSKALPKADKTMVDEAVRSAMAPFAQTITDSVDFERVYGEHFEAATTLAYSMAARGESPRKAAEAAVSAVVADQYEFRDTVRIPRSQPADAVLAGAETAKREALAPNVPLAIRASSFSNDRSAQAELKAAIEQGGYWITNEEGSGLVLMVPTRRGATAVTKPDGARYELTWGELVQKGVTPAGVVRDSATIRDIRERR
jgi:hypothetical protein